MRVMTPNENKMSDGGRGRASLGVEVWKSSQKWSAQRSAVRSIAWLDVFMDSELAMTPGSSQQASALDVAPTLDRADAATSG